MTDNAGATSTANLVITVTGTNDAPVAQAASFTVAEDAAVVNGTVTATDVDTRYHAELCAQRCCARRSHVQQQRHLQLQPRQRRYQSLAAGQSTVITVPYTVTDNAGATSTANLVITVTGTNDALVAQAASFTVAEDAAVVNGSVIATDVDAGATLSAALNGAGPWPASRSTATAATASTRPTRLPVARCGPANRHHRALTVTDNTGATSTANLVITVTGTNDAGGERQHGRCDGRQRADHHPGHAVGQ